MRLNETPTVWDLIIIGGGITGAGILREAIRMGLKAILFEQKDFAWGTSSRSSKMVHGGLRYIREGRLLLTKKSVEEREHLLRQAPGLVNPLGFVLPVYADQKFGKRSLKIGLSLYDALAGKRQHAYHGPDKIMEMLPHIKQEGLAGGFHFFDAQVDDARLVLRLIDESVACGAIALNYTSVTDITRNAQGTATGVVVQDTETKETKTFQSSAIINATGSWAEKLHPSPKPHLHLRPLRGSHLVFSADALPLKQGFSFMHPADNRGISIFPWEGAVVMGTTDLDHEGDLSIEPRITKPEALYLINGARFFFPSLNLTLKHCISTFAGIRPVLSEGKRPPSKESREHVVWRDRGLVTVTGGKLTTFRRLAWDALKCARRYLPPESNINRKAPIFAAGPLEPEIDHGLSAETWRRLYGRYGAAADTMIAAAEKQDLSSIPGTHTLWAELPYLARHENIRHLGDLLLRRVRIGLLVPQGGKALLHRIRNICNNSLAWDDSRWDLEIQTYLDQWRHFHAVPQVDPETMIQSTHEFQSLEKAS